MTAQVNGGAALIHPLALYTEFDVNASAPRWVIPGFIGHGVVVISGAQGVGKTTALLPLALVAAGLFGGELMPIQWRHVVYITEDVEQARRILAGIVGFGNLGVSFQSVRERLHIVKAVRLNPSFVAQVGKTYREQFSRTIGHAEVLPLVVFDTKSAVLAQENENDNSEASAMMAALKQGFDGLPVWLIGHVAKPSIGRADKMALSSRGAGALEADADQTLFLVQKDDRRLLLQGKTRFEPRWPALALIPYTADVPAKDEYGNAEVITLRWSIATPIAKSMRETATKAAQVAKSVETERLRQDIRDAVEAAWQSGNPLNRQGVKAAIRRQNSAVLSALEELLSERWVNEVSVPAKERTHPKRSAFLIQLSGAEREALLRGDGLPTAKQKIPESWKKATPSSRVSAFHRCTEVLIFRAA